MTKTYDLRPNMDVVAADGTPVGRIEHQEGPDRIKLAKDDGEEAYLSWDWVDRVEDGKVLLTMDRRGLEEAWQENPEGKIR